MHADIVQTAIYHNDCGYLGTVDSQLLAAWGQWGVSATPLLHSHHLWPSSPPGRRHQSLESWLLQQGTG